MSTPLIVNKEKWTKDCPKCGGKQEYGCKRSFLNSTKSNTLCRVCATIESSKHKDVSVFKTDEYRNKQSEMMLKARKTDSYGESFIEKCKTNALNRWSNSEFKTKMNKIMDSYEYRKKHQINTLKLWENLDHVNHMKKIHNSEEYKKIRRIISLQILTNKFGGGRISHVNKNACAFIDNLNKEKNWNLQHALNGGEIEVSGYSLDGYDKEKNIVFEYDESRHYTIENKLKKEDIERQQNIIDDINPSEFWRYNERTKILYNALEKDILCQ